MEDIKISRINLRYEKELDALGVKRRYIKNLRREKLWGKFSNDPIERNRIIEEYLGSVNTFRRFLIMSFEWKNTPEKEMFWNIVSKMYEPENLN